jgi:diguanylate cyclase (GGDEF)-like protein/PAS domain S-box-containing protein
MREARVDAPKIDFCDRSSISSGGIFMKISTFIRNNIEAILQEWEQFAASIQPGNGDMGKKDLQDHARYMLEDIADDLDSPESKLEQAEKSKGLNQEPGTTNAAGDHGLERLQSGFGIIELVSEYRFLRASVIRLWSEYRPQEEVETYDLIRFNEALDKQIYGAVGSFSVEKEKQTRLFVTVLSSSSDNGYILDLGGKFLYANKPMLQTINTSLGELVGKSHFDLGLSTAFEIHNKLNQVIQTAENRSGEVKYTLPTGEVRHYEYVFSPILDDENKVEAVAAAERDVTDRKLTGERDWCNANYDFLTGLPNRRLFRDRLDHDMKHAARTATSLALLFIDLDHFKEINDWLGHDAGDLLLKQIKERIVPCVRDTDTVARLGGDEFTVILLEPGQIEQIVTVVDKILKQLSLPFSILNETVNISACIGITLLPQDATEPEHLLKNADRAMYAAKKAGGNRFCFYNTEDEGSCLDTVKIAGWSLSNDAGSASV